MTRKWDGEAPHKSSTFHCDEPGCIYSLTEEEIIAARGLTNAGWGTAFVSGVGVRHYCPQHRQERVAIDDIAEERQRQIAIEGWTPAHDDAHTDGALAKAAACYAMGPHLFHGFMDSFWPWEAEWWKPGDRRRNLVKAGALIAAEIERLDRKGVAADGEQ